jgi:hypothetical protein
VRVLLVSLVALTLGLLGLSRTSFVIEETVDIDALWLGLLAVLAGRRRGAGPVRVGVTRR